MITFKKYDLGRCKALIVAAIATVLYTLVFILDGVYFETNDDSAIVRILTQANNSYAPFLGRILSWFLHKLYVWIPSVNHWTLLNYLFVFLGLGALVYAVFVRYHLWKAALINTLFMVATWHVCLNLMNFTRTAMIVAVGGMALIANAVFFQKKIHKTELGVGVFLFLLSAQIRFQCTLIALAFLGLITAVNLLKDHFRFEKAWFLSHMRTIITMLLVAVIVLSSSLVNTLLLTKEERAYERYNAARAQIEDYPDNYEYNNWDAYVEETGMTGEDLRTFLSWISEDTEVFEVETLEKVAAFKQGSKNLSAIKRLAKNNTWLLVVFAVFFVGKVVRKPKELWAPLTAALLLGFAFLVYLAYSGRLPDRVFMSIALCTFAAMVMMDREPACEGEGAERSKAYEIRRLIAFILVFASAATAFGYLAVDVIKSGKLAPKPREENSYYDNLRENVYRLIDETPENIYIMPIRSPFGTVCFSFGPWDAVEKDFCNNLFFLGGWDARMPHKIALLKERGIENPMRALFALDNVYSTYDGEVLAHLKRHYNENMTASGVSGEDRLHGCVLIQYSEPIASKGLQDSVVQASIKKLLFQPVDSVDAWYVSGELSRRPEQMEALYFNVVVDEKEYSYRMGLDGAEFRTYLYHVPKEIAWEETDACFVARLEDGSYQRIELNYDQGE